MKQNELFRNRRWSSTAGNEEEVDYKAQHLDPPAGWMRCRKWAEVPTPNPKDEVELFIRSGQRLQKRILTSTGQDKKGRYAIFRGDGRVPITVTKISDIYVPMVDEEARKKKFMYWEGS